MVASRTPLPSDLKKWADEEDEEDAEEKALAERVSVRTGSYGEWEDEFTAAVDIIDQSLAQSEARSVVPETASLSDAPLSPESECIAAGADSADAAAAAHGGAAAASAAPVAAPLSGAATAAESGAPCKNQSAAVLAEVSSSAQSLPALTLPTITAGAGSDEASSTEAPESPPRKSKRKAIRAVSSVHESLGHKLAVCEQRERSEASSGVPGDADADDADYDEAVLDADWNPDAPPSQLPGKAHRDTLMRKHLLHRRLSKSYERISHTPEARELRNSRAAVSAAILLQKHVRGMIARERFRRLRKRCLVAKELLETEASYVVTLRTIDKWYIKPLSAYAVQMPGFEHVILTVEEIERVFARIPEMLEMHSELYRRMQERLERWTAFQCIGDLFLNMVGAGH